MRHDAASPGFRRASGRKRSTDNDAVPPSVRVMTLVACRPLGDEPESRDLRALFLAMLARPAFIDLITDLSGARPGVSWQLRATPRRSNLKADLTGRASAEAPVASVMLELPVADLRLAGNDPRCAHLILHMDLPGSGDAAGLPAWRHRIILALALPGELARFLTKIGLPTSSDPATQLAVLVQARQALTEIIDPGGIKALPATYVVNESVGYLIADPAGEPAPGAASRVLRDLSERVLHLDGQHPVAARVYVLMVRHTGRNCPIIQRSGRYPASRRLGRVDAMPQRPYPNPGHPAPCGVISRADHS